MGESTNQNRGEITLKLLRQRKKISGERLAREVGVSYGSVLGWESGAVPSLENAIAIARALNVSLTELCLSLGFSLDGIPSDENKNA